jgi:hypothetical protein
MANNMQSVQDSDHEVAQIQSAIGQIAHHMIYPEMGHMAELAIIPKHAQVDLAIAMAYVIYVKAIQAMAERRRSTEFEHKPKIGIATVDMDDPDWARLIPFMDVLDGEFEDTGDDDLPPLLDDLFIDCLLKLTRGNEGKLLDYLARLAEAEMVTLEQTENMEGYNA